MHTQFMRALVVACMLLLMAMSFASDSFRERKLLDFGWRFHLGSAADWKRDFGFGSGQSFAKAGEAAGPARPSFDDHSWRQVDLPHDWVVEQDFVQLNDSLYVQHGSKPTGRQFPDQCVGWYRRKFDIPVADQGRRLSVEFDGVFRDSQVWINGHLLGREDSGYSSFRYDITDFVNYGGRNVLAVRVDASQYEGWFYEGAGIYRHVWLCKTDPVHVGHWGTYVTSEIARDTATLNIATEVANDSGEKRLVSVESKIVGPDGKEVATLSTNEMAIGAWSTPTIHHGIKFARPKLWSLEEPNLYTLRTRVLEDGKVRDQYDTLFGIRSIRFDARKGFFLNGKHVVIKGTCNHQDHAGVGSALPDRLQYFRIERLKEMGANAYRTSHNPPTPELLEACDRLGMLVMDENRLLDSSPEILGQLSRLIRRDRNHPSVILWSIGNEEPEQNSERGRRIAETMMRAVRELDPTRPITYAANNGTTSEGVNSVVDVRGVNYIAIGEPDAYHQAHPDQPMVGSEEASTLSTRGEYANDATKGFMRAYDTEKPGWGSTAERWWTYFAERPYLAGAFVWTGFDYRGEPTPYGWPCISSHFGIMDTCGFPKDNFYYYQSVWTEEPVLHLLPHWNWEGKEGQPIDVWCYSNLDQVEIFLNGKSLGRKEMPKNGHLEWSVAYAPGQLEARGYRAGDLVKTERVETTGDPARIILSPDRSQIAANGEDVSVVTFSIVDSNGRIVPEADNDVEFSIQGGEILGVGNGNPSSHERDKFITLVGSGPITGWEMQPLKDRDDPTALLKDWPSPRAFDAEGSAEGLPANTAAAYRARFDLTKQMIQGKPTLSIGQIDDLGWVYVNGKKLGETEDWSASYSFDLAPFVHEGANSIVIVVQNQQGPGGLGKGVSLSFSEVPPQWHRKVFHGLGQIIVRGERGKPGIVRLTASAEGLTPSTLRLESHPAVDRGY